MKCVHEFGLREGAQQEYRRRHDALWPEMRAMMLRAGLKNYSIWNVGTRLIEYYECADPEETARVIGKDPVKARWDAYMADILVYGQDGATQLVCMFDFNETERNG